MGGHRQQGSVLLISLMVLLVLAGISMIVVHKVSMEMTNVGTFRVSKQAYYVTEAGLYGPLAMAAKDQNAFYAALQTKGTTAPTVTVGDIYENFFDYGTWGSFGSQYTDKAQTGFSTRFSDPIDTNQIPGFSSAGFCYRKYTMWSYGFLGNDPTIAQASDPEDVLQTARAMFSAHVYLGPFQCGY